MKQKQCRIFYIDGKASSTFITLSINEPHLARYQAAREEDQREKKKAKLPSTAHISKQLEPRAAHLSKLEKEPTSRLNTPGTRLSLPRRSTKEETRAPLPPSLRSKKEEPNCRRSK